MDYRVETIKRQTRAVGAGLAYGDDSRYACSVCDTNSTAAAAVCRLWRYMPLPTPLPNARYKDHAANVLKYYIRMALSTFEELFSLVNCIIGFV